METSRKIHSQIEAILFFKNEPISVVDIAELLAIDVAEVERVVTQLQDEYKERGIRIVRHDNEIVLKTAPETGDLIAKLTKEEYSRDLGKAGLEVLSIILYKGPISRREIDYIRGVNSAFIIRNLLIRGLIEKIEGKDGGRGFTYKATPDLLSYMGIEHITELPEYNDVQKEIEALNTSATQESHGND